MYNLHPITLEPMTSRHAFINPDLSQHNRGLIGHYGPDNKMTIINDPNLLSDFDRKVFDYSIGLINKGKYAGGSMKIPTNADIKLKIVETKKVATNTKPKPKLPEYSKPIAEEASFSSGIYMKPGGRGTIDRNRDAANRIFKPEVEKLITSINSKSKDIKRIEISIVITTNTTNKTNIENIKKEIETLYPKANISIKLDPAFKISDLPGKISSTEDFQYNINVKGYGKK